MNRAHGHPRITLGPNRPTAPPALGPGLRRRSRGRGLAGPARGVPARAAGGGRRSRRRAGRSTPSSSAAQPSSCGVLGELVEQARRHLARPAPARRARSRPGRPPCPAARRGPCCRRPARSATRPAARPRRRAATQPVREGDGQRGQGDRVLEAGLLVEDAGLDRAQVRVRADVPPQVGVVLDRARRASSARPGASRSPRCRSAAGSPTRGKARKTGVREDIIPVVLPAPEGRVGRQREQQRQVAADPVGDVDRPVGALDRDVDVGAEDQLLAGDVAELLGELAVARAVDDLLVLPDGRTGACPAAPSRQPARLGDRADDSPAQLARAPRRRRRRLGRAWSRSRAPTASAPASPGPRASRRHRGEDRLDLLGEVEAPRRRGSSAPPRCRS